MRQMLGILLAWVVVAFVACEMGWLDMPWAREATREAAQWKVIR